METKKNPNADVNRRYSLHFSIGLMVAVACVVTAFEWRTAYEPPIVPEEIETAIPLIDESVITKIPDPPKPKIVMPKIVEAPDEIEIKTEAFVLDPEEVVEIEELPILDEELPEEVVEEYVDYAEVMPEPTGGMNEFMAFLARNIRYPKRGIRENIQGRVYVQFIVDEHGNLTDLRVIKGINNDFDEESLRVLSKAPAWKPGRQGGRPVKVRMVLPIIYRLN